jgi:hypothetical protein
MAYQSIGRGTSANDGTGDDLRTGAGKVNANFVELYTKLGDGSTLTADTVTLNAATQTLTNKTLTAPTITGAGAIAGVFTGNLTGNADTATTLATARTIAGQSFDGSTNITIAATDLSDTDQALATTGAVQFTGITSLGDGASAEGQIVLNCETNAHGQTIKPQPHSAAVTNTMLLPAGANSTLVSEIATQTLTNKTIDASSNTLSNIDNTMLTASAGITNAQLANNDVTIGTTAVALGASATTITGLTSVTSTNFVGDIDGVVGGTTPAAGSFTTVGLSDALQLAVFADATARDAAITSPSAGQVVFVTDGDGASNPQFHGYTGVAWVSLN